MTKTFADLGLQPELVQAVESLGFTHPTPIQEQVTPLLLDGHDVIGQAQTGTGKTAAFGLPMLHNIQSSNGHVQGLVVTPTRELANQVTSSFKDFAKFTGLTVLPVYGGQSYGRQKSALKRGVDVVVGTPGRLLDLISQRDLNLSHTHTIALDEADEMLSMGFIEDIETILQQLPKKRQTLLFSATMPKAIRKLADTYMSNTQAVTIERKALTAENIDQRYYLVNEKDRRAATMRLLEMEDITSVIIFGQTRIRTSDLATVLSSQGYAAEVLNGDLSQDARERVMSRFRKDQTKILVATDVAARGLDVDNVSHVINYDLPMEVENYVHRIGRTGRAGRSGVAISLLTPNQKNKISRIERHIKLTIPPATLPTKEDIQQRRNERIEENLLEILQKELHNQELAIVEKLLAEGHAPLDVAAAALKLSRAAEEQREIPHIGKVTNKPGRSRGGSSSRNRSGRGRGGSGRGGRSRSRSGGDRNRQRSRGRGKPSSSSSRPTRNKNRSRNRKPATSS